MDRRLFLKNGITSAAMMTSTAATISAANEKTPANGSNSRTDIKDRLCLFTDHLDDYGFSYQEVASMIEQLGVSGVDLTVRSGGLVTPERVVKDLPKAAGVLREHGLSIPMITTGLTSVKDPATTPTLTTAAKLGIGYYKLGYYQYKDASSWRSTLDFTRKELSSLVELGRKIGIRAGFHNHAGPLVGGALWDSWEVLESLTPRWIGFYFDPAQATIEGGKHGWNLGFHRLKARIHMIAIKDFVWEKVAGQWKTTWVPLGEGMVQWPAFFKALSPLNFEGPISLHIEYDPGGTSKAARLENSLVSAARDLAFLKGQLKSITASTSK